MTPDKRSYHAESVFKAVQGMSLPEQLAFRVGVFGGQHAGREDGRGQEFKHHRQYVPGDDPRRIDWAVFARTRRLYSRIHITDLAPRLDILFDTSPSMGAPSYEAKFLPALELVAGLALVAVHSGWLVDLTTFPNIKAATSRQTLSTSRDVFAATEALADQIPCTWTDHVDQQNVLGTLSTAVAQAVRRRAFVIVVSDFLVDVEELEALPDAWKSLSDLAVPDPVSPLQLHRLQLAVIRAGDPLLPLAAIGLPGLLVRIVGYHEDRPPKASQVACVESGRDAVVSSSRRWEQAYRAAVTAHGTLLRAMTRQLGLGYAQVVAGNNFTLEIMMRNAMDAIEGLMGRQP